MGLLSKCVFSFLAAVAVAQENCSSAITIKGLSAQLDGDWSPGVTELFGVSEFDYGKQHLTYGCSFCSDSTKKQADGKWAIWSDDPDNALKAILTAVCVEGCPHAGKQWPASFSGTAKWQLANQTVEIPGVAVKCCKRKAQPCDGCSNEACAAYKSTASCFAHSFTSDCCSARMIWKGGACMCQA